MTDFLCTYQFLCSCWASYTGRSKSILLETIREHYRAWLRRGGNKLIRSSIIQYLVNTGHSTKAGYAFKVTYKVSRKRPNLVTFHLFSIAASLPKHLEKAELHVQKKLHNPLTSWKNFPFFFSHSHLLPFYLLLNITFTPNWFVSLFIIRLITIHLNFSI